ncbi:hypothetical protein OMP40_03830 [Cohnella rhizosphaerae]|uniref:Uncharacterized protein n=1 Tax=Cohnella rhizosphaerae TaxID=1457232 RepID=A0A9X4KTM6_9BACL|nr:hypothetical protein [Cohnella rhizosphaerae]MDG0808614.1 hypothetical protein [Cohnella rhizosphaerae]
MSEKNTINTAKEANSSSRTFPNERKRRPPLRQQPHERFQDPVLVLFVHINQAGRKRRGNAENNHVTVDRRMIQLPLRPQHLAQRDKQSDPEDRAGIRKQRITPKRHAGNAAKIPGNVPDAGNEISDDKQLVPVLFKPKGKLVHARFRQMNAMPVPGDKRPAQPVSDPIRERHARQYARARRQDAERPTQLLFIYEKPDIAHHHLARKR